MRVRKGCLILCLAALGCGGSARPASTAIPHGDGWSCGVLPDRSTFCVRSHDECSSTAVECARSELAHCFTFVGADSAHHFSCKPRADECALQQARFARDERDVSDCEQLR